MVACSRPARPSCAEAWRTKRTCTGGVPTAFRRAQKRAKKGDTSLEWPTPCLQDYFEEKTDVCTASAREKKGKEVSLDLLSILAKQVSASGSL